ncbi:MAG TPA: bacillithiol biosynthesis BshC, partial [Calditrichia bacterium]|nr:bacillithiol biosynthesis BshC [Calditrichia bacterium]
MNISSLELPAGNALFAAYLNRDPQLKPFYPTHFLADPAETFAARAGQEYPRRELVEVLQKQNSGWGATAATLANIGKLADPQTLAVVTGQQAGILGGPLYTFYKILSVLKFSRLFAERHPGYQFVPVFWLEVNDADFAEISKTWYFDRANELKSLLLGENPADALKPIHYRQLDDSPAAWRDTLAEDTVESEFRDAVFDRYFEAYRAGAPIGEAMATLLHGLFGESGLVILNPADPAANRLARPLYERAIRTAGELSTLFGQRSAALAEAGFQAQ